MNKIKFFVFLWIVLSCFSIGFAYDKEYNISVLDTQLPQNGTIKFPLALQQNEFLYFNVTKSSNLVNFDYVNSYQLINTTEYNFSLAWNIAKTFYLADTNFTADLTISNSLNNNSYVARMNFEVKKVVIPVFDIVSVDTLQVINGSYQKNISILEFPGNGSLKFVVNGIPNTNFSVNGCEKNRFIVCNGENYTFNAQGKFNLSVLFNLPFTPIGTYNESFSINSTNKNESIKAQFNVVVPDIFLKPINIDPLCKKDESLLTIIERFYCEGLIAEYRMNILIQMTNYFSRVNTANICEQFVKTEYVVGDSISSKVLDENLKLLEENRVLRDKNNILNQDKTTCEEEKNYQKNNFQERINNLNNELEQTKITSRENSVEIFKRTETEKIEQRESLIGKMRLFCFLAILITLGLMGFKFWRENYFLEDVRINYYITGIIGLIFTFAWIGLWIWA